MIDLERIQRSLDMALADLHEDDVEAWSRASAYIGDAAMHGHPCQRCLPRLLELLMDERANGSVCFAIQALAMNGIMEPSCLPRLVELLNQKDARRRASGALCAMAGRGVHDPKQLGMAIGLLDDADPEVRSSAAGWIGWMARDGAIMEGCMPKLVPLLEHEHTQWNACLALCMLAERGLCDPGCLQRVIGLLDDPRTGVKNEAAGLIGCLAKNNIGDPECLPKLISMMDDKDLRWNACCALGMLAGKRIFDPSSLPKAVEALSDPRPKVRNEAVALIAALAMNGVHDESSIHPLKALLNDERTRNNARIALEFMAKKGIITAERLSHLQMPPSEGNEGSTELRLAIEAFFQSKTGDDAERNLRRIAKVVYAYEGKIDRNDELLLRRFLITLEGIMGPGTPIKIEAMRAAAALAYRGIANPTSVAILEKNLVSESSEVRDTAALALYRVYGLGLNNGHFEELYSGRSLRALDEDSRTVWLEDPQQ